MRWKETVEQLAENSGISQSLAKQIIILTEFLEKLAIQQFGEKIVDTLGKLPLIASAALDGDDEKAKKEIKEYVASLELEEAKEVLRMYLIYVGLEVR